MGELMSIHTLPFWQVEFVMDKVWRVVDGDSKKLICVVETEALARLIAAAPDLQHSGDLVYKQVAKLRLPVEDNPPLAYTLGSLIVALRRSRGELK
jgi:hypothetical protein